MRVLIRTAAGGRHGLGHACRMVALARALAGRGAEVEFLTTTPPLQACVAPFPCHLLTAWGIRGDVCVIDLKGWGAEAVLFDTKMVRIDNPTADPATTDLLVAPGVHWQAQTVEELRKDYGERLLYGWPYVMLDDAVTGAAPLPYSERAARMVCCTGGSNAARTLEQIYAWTATLNLTSELVLAYGRLASIPQCGPSNRPMTTILTPFDRRLLRNAAVVVSLFGVTCYEALWYRTPLLMLSLGGENHDGAMQLAQAAPGAVRDLGTAQALTAEGMCKALMEAWYAKDERWRMHTASQGLIDGHGVARVADAIMAL